MKSNDAFAERSVDLLKPSGERISFRVQFGPVRKLGESFRCRVRFHGWGNSPPDIWGYDSLEAVLLSITLVRSILAEFVRHGGRVLWPDTDMDYSLNFLHSLK
jgi:hypothetical protein